MAGPWVYLADNPEYYRDLAFEKGELVECHLYDDAGGAQGFGLWDIREQIEKSKAGLWVKARLIAVSDAHLKWWLTSGPGNREKRRFSLHFCAGPLASCKKKLQDPSFEFHTDFFRKVVAGCITDKKIGWFKDESAKDDIAAEVSRLEPPAGEMLPPKRRPP
jgi:hypothetical protein